jgi:hypothetical protein
VRSIVRNTFVAFGRGRGASIRRPTLSHDSANRRGAIRSTDAITFETEEEVKSEGRRDISEPIFYLEEK